MLNVTSENETFLITRIKETLSRLISTSKFSKSVFMLYVTSENEMFLITRNCEFTET